MRQRMNFRKLAQDEGGQSSINDIGVGTILLGVALILGLTMVPLIADTVATAQANGNITTAQSTMLDLVTLGFIVSLVVGGLGFVVKGVRNFGKN